MITPDDVLLQMLQTEQMTFEEYIKSQEPPSETIDRLSLSAEGMPSQFAQSSGFWHGNRQSPPIRRIITNYWRNWFLHKIIVP